MILAFIFCNTVAPRGIPSDNEMTWLELTQSLVVPSGSPAVFCKGCVITEAIWCSCVVSFLVCVADVSSWTFFERFPIGSSGLVGRSVTFSGIVLCNLTISWARRLYCPPLVYWYQHCFPPLILTCWYTHWVEPSTVTLLLSCVAAWLCLQWN